MVVTSIMCMPVFVVCTCVLYVCVCAYGGCLHVSMYGYKGICLGMHLGRSEDNLGDLSSLCCIVVHCDIWQAGKLASEPLKMLFFVPVTIPQGSSYYSVCATTCGVLQILGVQMLVFQVWESSVFTEPSP